MQRFVEWHRLYLIFSLFLYSLQVNSYFFEQLSKYSNIYRAGRAGREGTRAMGRGDRHQLVPRACHVSSVPAAAVEVQICERTSLELQRCSCECTGSLCELPSRHTDCSTDGVCQPGQCLHCLLQVRLLLQSSGLQRCWREEEDEGGTKQSPRQDRWLLGE